jgi:hypothetical protein
MSLIQSHWSMKLTRVNAPLASSGTVLRRVQARWYRTGVEGGLGRGDVTHCLVTVAPLREACSVSITHVPRSETARHYSARQFIPIYCVLHITLSV